MANDNRYKVELSTGKTVVLMEFKIKDKNLAAQAAAAQGVSGSGPAVDAIMQDEVLKIILESIGGKKLEPHEKENLDNLFSYSEYQELMVPIAEMLGTTKTKKPKVTILTGQDQTMTSGAK